MIEIHLILYIFVDNAAQITCYFSYLIIKKFDLWIDHNQVSEMCPHEYILLTYAYLIFYILHSKSVSTAILALGITCEGKVQVLEIHLTIDS